MKKLFVSLVFIGSLLLFPVPAGALSSSFGSLVGDSCDSSGLGGNDSTLCSSAGKNEKVDGFLLNIINFMLYLVGILAVIMIIVSAIKFATSAGNSAKLTSAKNTLLYSVIGLAIAVLSFAIVNLVIAQSQKPTSGSPAGPARPLDAV